jgi:hypothetical protein
MHWADLARDGCVWRIVQALSQLQRLAICNVTPYLDDPGGAAGATMGATLARLTRLTHLDLTVQGVHAAVRHLATLPQLACVHVNPVTMRDASRQVQAQLTRLTQVWLVEEEFTTLPDLTRHSQLASLKLPQRRRLVQDTDATRRCCQHVAALTALRRLECFQVSLGWGARRSIQCATQLAAMTALTSLSLRSCLLQPRFIMAFGKAAGSMAALVLWTCHGTSQSRVGGLVMPMLLLFCWVRCRSSRC